jgi:hypothetical protein
MMLFSSCRSWICRRGYCIASLLLAAGHNVATAADDPSFNEIRSFPAPEAHQGVAVDAAHFYAITNRAVAKYDKKTGKLVNRWDSTDEVALKHLNSGVVFDGKLYGAHSTWPTKPPKNTIEIWDTKTMTHLGRKTFGENQLALTWADRYEGAWWVVFCAYGDAESVAKTKLIKFDDDWKPLATWRFPREVIDRFVPYSNSGGSIGPDGLLYATGHDRKEVYVLELPEEGKTLKLIRTMPIGIEGQAIAWDRSNLGVLFGIRRKAKEVVVSRLIGDGQTLRKAGVSGFDKIPVVEQKIILRGIEDLTLTSADFLFDGGSLSFVLQTSSGRELVVLVPNGAALTEAARKRQFQPVLISNSKGLNTAAILAQKSVEERQLQKLLHKADVQPKDALVPEMLSRNLKLLIAIVERRQTLKKYGPDALGW